MHNRERIWRTADGRSVAVKDMQLGHLVNVINWISDNPISYPQSIRTLMIEEAKYRQLELFSTGQPYPQQVGRSWKIMDPQTGEGRIEKPPADYIEAVKENEAYQAMSKRTQTKRQKSST